MSNPLAKLVALAPIEKNGKREDDIEWLTRAAREQPIVESGEQILKQKPGILGRNRPVDKVLLEQVVN